MIAAADAAQQLADAFQATTDAAYAAAVKAGDSTGGAFDGSGAFSNASDNGKRYTSGGVSLTSGLTDFQLSQTPDQQANLGISTGGGINGAISSVQGGGYGGWLNPATDGPQIAKQQAYETQSYQTLQTLYDLKNAGTNDNNTKIANYEAEMAFLQSRPETIARDQAISSLQQSIDGLTTATKANTAATLNPLYTQGAGALAIGYYHAATGLDATVQGSGGTDSVPVHIMMTPGETLSARPPGQSSNDNSGSSSRSAPTQNIYMDLRGMDSNTARRNRRQVAQGLGQAAAAGR
jgi:hypothetical protein